jgi:hypothetical protein
MVSGSSIRFLAKNNLGMVSNRLASILTPPIGTTDFLKVNWGDIKIKTRFHKRINGLVE